MIIIINDIRNYIMLKVPFSGIGFIEAILRTPWYCAIGMVVSFLPQVYWFKLMFKGAMKMLRSRATVEPKLKLK